MPIFRKEITMSEVNLNLAGLKQQEMKPETTVETGGVIASNTPSPLFTAAPATSVETGGSIASSGGSSSGGGFSMSC